MDPEEREISYFSAEQSFFDKYKWYLVGGLVLLIILAIVGFIIYKKKKSGGSGVSLFGKRRRR